MGGECLGWLLSVLFFVTQNALKIFFRRIDSRAEFISQKVLFFTCSVFWLFISFFLSFYHSFFFFFFSFFLSVFLFSFFLSFLSLDYLDVLLQVWNLPNFSLHVSQDHFMRFNIWRLNFLPRISPFETGAVKAFHEKALICFHRTLLKLASKYQSNFTYAHHAQTLFVLKFIIFQFFHVTIESWNL